MATDENHFEFLRRTLFCQASTYKALSKVEVMDRLIALRHSGRSLGTALYSYLYAGIDGILRSQQSPYSFSEYADGNQALEVFDLPAISSLDRTLVSVICYHYASHLRAGERTYRVSPALADQLLDTELRGLTTDDLRLPYEAILIELPPNAELKLWNQLTGWHDAYTVYVCEDPAATVAGKDPKRAWRIMVAGRGKPDCGDYDDAVSFFRVDLPSGMALDDALDAVAEEMRKDETRHPELAAGWANMAKEWRRIFRFVMNCVLYSTWNEPGECWELNREARQLWERIQKLPAGEKRRKLHERYSRMPKRPRILLGHKIVVDRSRESAVGDCAAFVGGPGVRTRVSGHWRRQAHGPQNTLRRLQWIEPHWRNLDGEVVPQSVHELR